MTNDIEFTFYVHSNRGTTEHSTQRRKNKSSMIRYERFRGIVNNFRIQLRILPSTSFDNRETKSLIFHHKSMLQIQRIFE